MVGNVVKQRVKSILGSTKLVYTLGAIPDIGNNVTSLTDIFTVNEGGASGNLAVFGTYRGYNVRLTALQAGVYKIFVVINSSFSQTGDLKVYINGELYVLRPSASLSAWQALFEGIFYLNANDEIKMTTTAYDLYLRCKAFYS